LSHIHHTFLLDHATTSYGVKGKFLTTYYLLSNHGCVTAKQLDKHTFCLEQKGRQLQLFVLLETVLSRS